MTHEPRPFDSDAERDAVLRRWQAGALVELMRWTEDNILTMLAAAVRCRRFLRADRLDENSSRSCSWRGRRSVDPAELRPFTHFRLPTQFDVLVELLLGWKHRPAGGSPAQPVQPAISTAEETYPLVVGAAGRAVKSVAGELSREPLLPIAVAHDGPARAGVGDVAVAATVVRVAQVVAGAPPGFIAASCTVDLEVEQGPASYGSARRRSLRVSPERW